MIIKAKFSVELNGHIYAKGESAEYTGVLSKRIADNFTDADGRPIAVPDDDGNEEAVPAPAAEDANPPEDEVKSKIDKTVSVLGREGIKQGLEGMGITFSPKAKTEFLAKLLLMSKGEIEE